MFLHANAYNVHPKSSFYKNTDISTERLEDSPAFRAFAAPLVIRRVRYSVPDHEPIRYNIFKVQSQGIAANENFQDIIKGKIDKEEGVNSWFRIIFSFVMLVISGLVGFYMGKLQESRNYVRVPAPN